MTEQSIEIEQHAAAFAQSGASMAAAPGFIGKDSTPDAGKHGRNIRGNTFKGPSMIKIHILQVNSKYATEVARLKRDVTAGFTKDNWKTLKGAKAGDIAVWYVAGGPQVYAAWGWVSGVSHHVKPGEPFGPYQGPVAGMQWLPEEIDARMVRDLIGVDGGHEGPRTVPDEKAVAFLQMVGLLPQ